VEGGYLPLFQRFSHKKTGKPIDQQAEKGMKIQYKIVHAPPVFKSF
jgi:hypothetical protein